MRQMFGQYFPRTAFAPRGRSGVTGLLTPFSIWPPRLGMWRTAAYAEWGTMPLTFCSLPKRLGWVVTFPGLAILLTVLAFNLDG